jgi:hypothetical protein
MPMEISVNNPRNLQAICQRTAIPSNYQSFMKELETQRKKIVL